MKIALAQLNYHIGNFSYNTGLIIDAIRKADAEKCRLIVFSELAVCGYPPRDFLEFDDFIRRSEEALAQIAACCTGIAAVVGAPIRNPRAEGKPLVNAACFLYEGKLQHVQGKSLLPNYDVFDEYRYFEPNRDFGIVEYLGEKIALTVCEDLWNIDPDPLYVVQPVEELMRLSPGILINIAASPFSYNQQQLRRTVLSDNAARYKIPLIYVNHCGAQTELIFDGNSQVLNSKGQTVLKLANFSAQIAYIDTDEIDNIPPLPDNTGTDLQDVSLIYQALVTGVHDYFGKQGFTKAILGLSGGIDSALTLAIACDALGAENVTAVLLPSRFSSDHSVTDSLQIVKNTGCKHHIISIEKAFENMESSLSGVFAGLPFNIAEENIQARLRAVILMAMSNKFGCILLNTSNKSEAAVGYGTLYGDMCGGISVLGDVYKTQVYRLSDYVNRSRTIIPHNIIKKAPSAELRPNQTDQDSLPEYALLDRLLFQYIEKRKSPAELVSEGFDKELVDKVMKLVNNSEYKRHQSPPILRISPKAFGTGRRMPIVAKYLS